MMALYISGDPPHTPPPPLHFRLSAGAQHGSGAPAARHRRSHTVVSVFVEFSFVMHVFPTSRSLLQITILSFAIMCSLHCCIMTTIFPNGAFDIGRVKEEPTVSGCKYLGTHRTAPTVGVDAVTIRHLRDTLALFASVPATAGPESIQIKRYLPLSPLSSVRSPCSLP